MSLVASSVTVRRGARTLLDRVNLELPPGRLVALVGPNGAGKSTLVRVLGGDLVPDAGKVMLSGRPLRGYPLVEIARRRAVVPQLSRLDFPFAVRDVVGLGRYPHGDADTPRGQAAVGRALTAFDLNALADAHYPSLSGGERQRTHAARAMAQVDGEAPDGAWLLLDEPTAALDLVHQHRLLGALRAFVAQGGGVLVVVHDLNQASEYADELVLLSEGKLFATGTPQEVLTESTLRTLFGVEVRVVVMEGVDHPVVVTSGRPDWASSIAQAPAG